MAIVLGGTGFFGHVAGRGWPDARFFAAVTLSTVGHGSLVPITAPECRRAVRPLVPGPDPC